MPKQTLGCTKVLPGDGWIKLCEDAHYIQNIDKEPVYFFYSENEPPANVDIDDCHVFRQEQDDNLVTDAGDTIWIRQLPNTTQRIVITKLEL